MNKPKKFIPVMLMPFQENLSIDYEALEKLIELYLKAGAKGLFANCLSSEMFDLSKDEMLESIDFIIKKVHGRVPVVATGTFDEPLERQAEFIRKVYDLGVDSVIVITGLMATEDQSNEEFEQNVLQLLNLTKEIPLGFYECPVPYKRLIAPEFLGKLSELGRVKYHKDTSLDLDHINRKLANTVDNAQFGLFDAYMVHAVDSLLAGSAGLSCIQGNYFPELIVWLCNHYDDVHKQEAVNEVQDFLRTQMEVMHYAYPTAAKYYLQQGGFPIALHTRRMDIEELDEQTKTKLDQLSLNYQDLKMRLQI
ncbi:dihydrodipicolinate synthase family protein [Sphingobacterium sp. HJSM2_6]|uniref:dihydrodipicolinate synthase family protein n=1 Tax=Sphingobacterium sp. HJSM2_6 TaxID=3366264 RepID=UPI003BE20D2E